MVLVGKTGQIVIAGDPMQMGPLCFDPQANARGLPISMIKRLFDCYENVKLEVRISNHFIFFIASQFNSQYTE